MNERMVSRRASIGWDAFFRRENMTDDRIQPLLMGSWTRVQAGVPEDELPEIRQLISGE